MRTKRSASRRDPFLDPSTTPIHKHTLGHRHVDPARAAGASRLQHDAERLLLLQKTNNNSH
jgi:hypothetical protein